MLMFTYSVFFVKYHMGKYGKDALQDLGYQSAPYTENTEKQSWLHLLKDSKKKKRIMTGYTTSL